MNREEKENLAQNEWLQAMKEYDQELKAIEQELKSKGIYRSGLDANEEFYKPATARLKKRIKEIQNKYQ